MLNELLIGSFYLCILLKESNVVDASWNKISDICIYIMIASWVLNILCSIIVSFQGVVAKIREFLRKRREKKAATVYAVKNEDKRNTVITSEMFYIE